MLASAARWERSVLLPCATILPHSFPFVNSFFEFFWGFKMGKEKRGKETFWKKLSFPRTPNLQKLSNRGLFLFNIVRYSVRVILSGVEIRATRGSNNAKHCLESRTGLAFPCRSRCCASPYGFDFTSFRSGWHEGVWSSALCAQKLSLQESFWRNLC